MGKIIKVGLASYGMSGEIFHAPLLHTHAGFEMCKILERTKERSKERYGYAKTVKTFDEILKDNNIELIIVNTPDHLHYDMAMQALKANKHVVVEKPFTLLASDAEKLIEEAAKRNLILSVFQNRRWDGDFLTVKKVLQNKLIGRLVEFESHFDRYKNFIQAGTWKEDAGTGTGTLYNLGSHMIDQALVLFGKPNGVMADVRVQRTDGTVDDSFAVRLQYPNMKVVVKGSYLVREPGPRYILHGTDGSFLKHGIDPQEEDLKNGLLPTMPGWGMENENDWGLLNTQVDGLHFIGNIETIPGNYNFFYDNIHEAITQGANLAVQAEEALLVIKIIEAAFKSNQEQKLIMI